MVETSLLRRKSDCFKLLLDENNQYFHNTIPDVLTTIRMSNTTCNIIISN